jgi:hypothetical protein
MGAEVDVEQTYLWVSEDPARINPHICEVVQEIAPDASSSLNAAATLGRDKSRVVRGTDTFVGGSSH